MRCCINNPSNHFFSSSQKKRGSRSIFLVELFRVVHTNLSFKSHRIRQTESSISHRSKNYVDDIALESSFGEQAAVPKYTERDKKNFRTERFNTDKYSVPQSQLDGNDKNFHRTSPAIDHEANPDDGRHKDQRLDFSEYFEDWYIQAKQFKIVSFNQGTVQYALGRTTSPLAPSAKSGSCLGFSTMWLESLANVDSFNLQQSQARMGELKILASAIEAAQRQNKYTEEILKDDTVDVYYRGVKSTLNFFGLGAMQTIVGGPDDFSRLIKSMKPGDKALYVFSIETEPMGHHAMAFCCLSDGSFLFFDPNGGEFHIPGRQIKSFIPQFIKLRYGYSARQELRIIREDLLINDHATKSMQYKLVEGRQNSSFISPGK